MPKINTPEQAVNSTILSALKSRVNSLKKKRARIEAEIEALETQIDQMTPRSNGSEAVVAETDVSGLPDDDFEDDDDDES